MSERRYRYHYVQVRVRVRARVSSSGFGVGSPAWARSSCGSKVDMAYLPGVGGRHAGGRLRYSSAPHPHGPTRLSTRTRSPHTKAVNYHEESDVARFWRLWTGNAHCRNVVTSSPKDSLFRKPKELEKKLVQLRRVLPAKELDIPMICARDPRILELSTREVVAAFVRVRFALGDPPLCCNVCTMLTLGPSLLLCDAAELRTQAWKVVESVGDVESARTLLESNPMSLMSDGEEYAGGSRGKQYNRAVVYQ